MWVTSTHQHGQALQFLCEHLFPVGARLGVVDAGVHHGPALAAVDAVAQQPQIDVVEREGQLHAHPLDPGASSMAPPRGGS